MHVLRHRRHRLHRQAPRQDTARAHAAAIGVFPRARGKPRPRCDGAARVLGRRQRRARSPVVGDLTAAAARRRQGRPARSSTGKIKHFFHLAAVYDLKADAETQDRGQHRRHAQRRSSSPTRSTPGHFHHVSSIAAAGLYEGVFREDMFDEAENLDHPYFATKHESREDRAQGVPRCRGASTAPASSSATRGPARWTRSTGRTTSSS